MSDTAKKASRPLGLFRESLRDAERDYTRGPIGRALGLLAIPMMLEMSMESVFAIVDIAFVSALGTDAIAAVGITEAVVTVLFAVAIGLSTGVTAMVARRVGAGNAPAATRAVGQALWIGALVSLVFGCTGIVFATDILGLMGASETVVESGRGYTTVLLGGSFSIIYLFLLNAAFRGAGDAGVALRSLWLANGLNIILDPCLIFGLGPFPEMGVTGAAVATTIGRSCGILYQLWYLFGPRGQLTFRWSHLRPDTRLARRMLIISFGGIGQFLISTTSWIVIMRIVALYGSTAIAAYTIALRLLEFVWLPAWGLGNAAATLVGQSLGAGRPLRAEKSAWLAARYNVIFLSTVGISVVLTAPQIAGAFSSEVAVITVTTDCLRILGIGFPIYAVGMILTQTLNGAGDTKTPLRLNFVCFWLIQIPLAYYLASVALFGPNGVFLAIVVSECLLTLLTVVVFRQGKWKLTLA